MDLFFALAMPLIGSQGRARFRRKLVELRENSEEAVEVS